MRSPRRLGVCGRPMAAPTGVVRYSRAYTGKRATRGVGAPTGRPLMPPLGHKGSLDWQTMAAPTGVVRYSRAYTGKRATRGVGAPTGRPLMPPLGHKGSLDWQTIAAPTGVVR